MKHVGSGWGVAVKSRNSITEILLYHAKEVEFLFLQVMKSNE